MARCFEVPYSSARGGIGVGARTIPALLEVAATYEELGRDGDLVKDLLGLKGFG